jgi:hypothetical protein
MKKLPSILTKEIPYEYIEHLPNYPDLPRLPGQTKKDWQSSRARRAGFRSYQDWIDSRKLVRESPALVPRGKKVPSKGVGGRFPKKKPIVLKSTKEVIAERYKFESSRSLSYFLQFHHTRQAVLITVFGSMEVEDEITGEIILADKYFNFAEHTRFSLMDLYKKDREAITNGHSFFEAVKISAEESHTSSAFGLFFEGIELTVYEKEFV